MDIQEIQDKITKALSAVSGMEDEHLKTVAFQVVLKSLLNELQQNGKQQEISSSNSVQQNISADTEAVKAKSIVINSLSITQEQLSEIYEIDGKNLKLKAKVTGDKTSEQQRNLAEVVLFGYKVFLDVKEVSGSIVLAVAKEWDIPTKHFVKNVKSNEYLQIRNIGTGKDPILSLKPGVLNKLAEKVKVLASLPS